MKYFIQSKINKHYLLLSVCFMLSKMLFAQQYPINVSANLLNPMPSKLSNYYLDNAQKLFVVLTNKDLANPSIPVKLKFTIIGSSTQIVSRVGSEIGVSPIFLDAGMPKTLTQQELAPYFNINNLDFVGGFSTAQYNTTGVLPEGNYSICVQVLDYYNNRVLSNSVCTYGSIFFSQPPTVLTPVNETVIRGGDSKIITFNWVPNHLNNRDIVSGGFKYIVTLKELLDSTQNTNQAYVTANTKLTEEVSSNQFILNTLTTPLISGRKYAWTVQVKANNIEAQPTISNDGVSQVFGFIYDDNCSLPKNIATTISKNKATITWENVAGSVVNSVKYKEINGVEYTKNIPPNASSISLENLNYQTDYEFTLVAKCGSNMLVLDSKQFSVLPKVIAQKALFKSKVSWGVKEGSQGDYTATGFSLKTIFQGVSDKISETPVPNNKLGLKFKSNDTTVTLSNSSANIVAKKPLKGAKISLFENGEIIQSVNANNIGNYEMPIDTQKIVDNPDLKYYVKFETPTTQMGRNDASTAAADSIILSGIQNGNDILKALSSKEIVLSSANYTIIHPVVYVGPNQSDALSKKAGGKVDVFISTTDKSSLARRVLDYKDNNPTNESYNGESYLLIGTLDDTKAFLPIVQLNSNEKLLFRVSLRDNPTQYYPLSILPENRNTKIINVPLDYNPFVKIQGKVFKNAQKQLEGLNKSAVVAYNKTTNEMLDAATTNTDGTYLLQYIPSSQVDNIVVNAAPFNEYSKKMDNSRSTNNYRFTQKEVREGAINRDIQYDKQTVDIIYGQAIMTNSKKAVANITIYYDKVKVVTTSGDGFFAFKLNASQRDPNKFTIVCDGKEFDRIKTNSIIQQKFGAWESQAKTTSYSRSDENKNNSDLLTKLITQSNTYGDTSRRAVSALLDTTKENFGNYYLANLNIADIFYYNVITTFRGKKESVILTDVDKKTTINVTAKDTVFLINSDVQKYKFTIKPAPNKSLFAEQKDVVINFSKAAPSVTIVLTPIIKIKGIIKDSASNSALDSVSVELEKLNANATTSNKGEFEISVGETKEAKVLISKKGYFSKDTILKLTKLTDDLITINVKLRKIPNAAIAQMGGFNVKITGQTFVKDSTYKISGKLTLDKDNDIFASADKSKTLTFTNVEVRVDATGNAAPVIDSVKFTETQIDAKMFNFAPIVVSKIQLRKKMDGSSFSEGVITGLVTVMSSSFKKLNPNFPLSFEDALLKIPDNSNYIYVFSPNAKKIKAFSKTNTFYLKFGQSAVNAGAATKPEDKEGYVKNTILKDGSVNTSKDSCFISKDGITLTGNVGLPNSIFTGNGKDKSKSNVTVNFGSLQIDTLFKVQDLVIDLSKKPIITNLKKWQLQVEMVKLIGFNTPKGRGLGFGGKLYLTKPTKNTKDTMRNVLRIKTFEVKQNEGGNLDVLAEFIPPPKDINIKSLKFTPSEKDHITMGYTEADGFTLRCAGKITSSDSTSKFSKITKKIFPLEVETFQIKSKNWAVFASVKPTTEFNFKGVKIAIERAVINVGTDMTIEKMNQYVEGDVAEDEPAASPDEFEEEDPKTAWAFGVKGSVSFEREGMKKNTTNFSAQNVGGQVASVAQKPKDTKTSGSIAASFVVGEFNNEIKFRINDIEIEFESPAAQLSAKVRLKLEGDTIGVAGAGKIKIGGFELDTATFHFYKIKDKDYDIGAMIRVPIALTTGPISWYSVGGGFNYQSSTNTIEAFFSRTAGPAGTVKASTLSYVDIKKLGVVFNINECGARPILQGEASVFMKTPGSTSFDNWGTMTTKIDFCKNLLLVTAKGGVKNFLPGVDVNIDGVLFGVANKGGGQGAMLLCVNGQVNAGSFLTATGQLALGINYNNNMADLPNEVKNIFATIPAAAKSGNNNSEMNALVVKVDRTISTGNMSNSFNSGPVNVSVKYTANQTINAGLLANFATNNYKVNFGIKMDVSGSGSASIGSIGFGLGFNANASAVLNGGYSDQEGFNVRGDLYASINGSTGCCNSGCNDWCWKSRWFGCCLGAKVCANAKLSVGWSKRDGFNFYGVSLR